MTNRTKTMLMMFADYGICLLLQFFSLYILSLIQDFPWGYPVYSILLCLLLFCFHYVRTHKAARRDMLREETRKTAAEGLLLATPLAAFHLLLIVLYACIQFDVIPIGSAVIKTAYTFPDNAPRVATDVVLMDYITPCIRVWFGTLIGFMPQKTSAPVLLITPALTLLAGFAGYLAGRKKFYLSEVFAGIQKKIIDKFNE